MALLTFILVVAILLGWWTDRHRLQLKVETQIQAARFGKLKLFEHLRRPEVIGRDISEFPEVPALADDTSDDSMVPLHWDRVAPDRDGKECIGYYFQTGELVERLEQLANPTAALPAEPPAPQEVPVARQDPSITVCMLC